MKEYSFEKLGVWKEARKLSLKVYKLTAKFPVEEKYVLTSQMRRAITSVCSNLAEGVSRISFKGSGKVFRNILRKFNGIIVPGYIKFRFVVHD